MGLLGYVGLVLGTIFLGYLAARIHPVVPLVVVIGGWAVAISVRNPFAFLLFFLIFTLGRVAEFVPQLQSLSLGKVFILSAIAIFIMSKALERDYSLVPSPHNRWMLLLLFGVMVSSVLGYSFSASFGHFKESFVKVLIYYFLLVNIIRTPKQAIIFQLTLSVIVCFLGGYALLAKILGVDPVTGAELVEGSRSALAGALGDPNDLSLVLLMPLPFCVACMVDLKGKQKLIMTLITVLTVAGIASTQSRGGLIGMSLGIGLLLNRRIRNKVLLIGVVVIFIAGMFTAAGLSERRTAQQSSGGLDDSASGRLLAWEVGIEMFIRSPIWGVGLDRFADAGSNTRLGYKEPHNTLVKALTETGLIGFIPFGFLIFLTLRGGWRLGKNLPRKITSFEQAYKIGLFPSFVGFLASAFFINHSWTFFLYIFHAQMAASLSMYQLDDESVEKES